MQSTDTTDDARLKATAREVATFCNGRSKGDATFVCEALYRGPRASGS